MTTNPVNNFGQQLVSEWRPQNLDENLIFSPLSIALCFLLVYNGARGQTRSELETVFGFEDERVRSDLLSKLTEYSGVSAAQMANRIYVEQSVTLEDAYVASIGSANVESVDFVRASENVRVQINAWVSERTAGLIPNLIPPGVLSSSTVLAAINALYFKGNWQTRFPLDRTMDDTFHAVAGDQTVPFMSLSGQRFRVKEVDALDAVLFAMPYEGNAFTMYVLLPNTLDGWRTAEQSLSGQIGTLFGDGFVEREVDLLRVPKWEMEMTLGSLSSMLVNLGLSTAFSSGAGFSGITQDAPLAISEVIHMAKITVDEEGTEAAAATFIGVFATSISIPFNIIVDHPFLYFVVDEADGTILFQGTQTSI